MDQEEDLQNEKVPSQECLRLKAVSFGGRNGSVVSAAAYKLRSSDPQLAGVVRHDQEQEQHGRVTCAAQVLTEYGLDTGRLAGKDAAQAVVTPTKLVKRL